ncbi:threonine--tRNA ligase, partial [Candidatus Dojkabacteria bacterium]|nr:threonine--tRNA ligase [Candidatus Dojkabacteria bacterium]
IEKEMKKLIKANLPITRKEVSLEEAREIFKDNPYKQEWLQEIEEKDAKVTLYYTGDLESKNPFVDLCKGPHVDKTGEIGSIKLLSLAGAYWRGDEKNKMLTRVYGTAFEKQEELDKYLWQLEEAKKRDHRALAKRLELYFIDDMVGKGLIMWLPNGTIMRDEIERLAKEKEKEYGYQRVVSPHIAKKELFLTSGHLPYYEDDMYPAMEMDDGTYYLKAMNCPHHHRMYLHKPRSYKEFPIRFAEYGTCYRNELSGTLAGLLRVRCLAMNDSHIYVRKDQIKEEFKQVMNLTMEYFEIFGLEDYWFRLSKWDPERKDKYIDEPDNWKYSENVIREVLEEMGVKYIEADDEAAFYGPKVDVQFKSVIGREETMSTIQLDFAAKTRFNLEYVDEEGNKNNEVFVIHRAPLSVHERFLAFVIEHFAGNFPAWLAPEQVRLIPISDQNNSYAEKLAEDLRQAGVRVSVDSNSERMQKKVKEAQEVKVPYMLILGAKEEADKAVSVRYLSGEQENGMKYDDFKAKLMDNISNRSLDINL